MQRYKMCIKQLILIQLKQTSSTSIVCYMVHVIQLNLLLLLKATQSDKNKGDKTIHNPKVSLTHLLGPHT